MSASGLLECGREVGFRLLVVKIPFQVKKQRIPIIVRENDPFSPLMHIFYHVPVIYCPLIPKGTDPGMAIVAVHDDEVATSSGRRKLIQVHFFGKPGSRSGGGRCGRGRGGGSNNSHACTRGRARRRRGKVRGQETTGHCQQEHAEDQDKVQSDSTSHPKTSAIDSRS